MKEDTLKKANELIGLKSQVQDLIRPINGQVAYFCLNYDARFLNDSVKIHTETGLPENKSGRINISEKAQEALKILSQVFHEQVLKVLKYEQERIEKEFTALQDEPEMELIDE